MRRRLRRLAEFLYNRARGCYFFWIATPGTPAGGYWEMTEKCCPCPLLFDWSAKACAKAGLCGCNKNSSPTPTTKNG